MHNSLTVLADETSYINVNACFKWRALRPSTECQPGFFVELMDLIRTRLNMTVHFINGDRPETLPPDVKLVDRDSIFGALRNGSVDFLAAFFDNTDAYGEDFEVTRPIYFSHIKFVVAHSKASLTGMFDFFAIYDLYIWIFAFLCFVLVISVGLLIHLVASKFKMNESEDFGSFAWQITRLHLNQCETIKQKLVSANTLTVCFALLQGTIIMRMYSNSIKTQTVRYVDPYPFKPHEIAQVIKDKRYSFIFQSNLRWWYQDIMNKNLTGSPLYELRNAVKHNPIVLADELGIADDRLDEFVMQQVRDGPWITIDSNEGIEFTRQMGFCNNMIYMDTNFLPRQKSLLMRKNHPLLPQINQIILEESVYIRRLHEKYYKYTRPSKCEEEQTGPKALGMVPFWAVLIIFGIGIAAAIFAFLIEFLFKGRKERGRGTKSSVESELKTSGLPSTSTNEPEVSLNAMPEANRSLKIEPNVPPNSYFHRQLWKINE